jgi:hypothetical protein
VYIFPKFSIFIFIFVYVLVFGSKYILKVLRWIEPTDNMQGIHVYVNPNNIDWGLSSRVFLRSLVMIGQ